MKFVCGRPLLLFLLLFFTTIKTTNLFCTERQIEDCDDSTENCIRHECFFFNNESTPPSPPPPTFLEIAIPVSIITLLIYCFLSGVGFTPQEIVLLEWLTILICCFMRNK